MTGGFLKNSYRLFKLSNDMKKGRVRMKNLPFRLWIEPTNSCNFKCIMCPQRVNKEKRGFMSLKTFKKIIDEAKDFASDVNLFFGGEPLLHPQIIDMIKYAKDKGLRVRMETNASLLDREKSLGIIKNKVDFISFSFDGYSKEDYERIRVGGKYEQTLRNIINFLKIKASFGAKKPYTLIQVIEINQNSGMKKKRGGFFSNFKGLPVDNFRIVSPHRFGGKIDEKITGSTYAYVRKGKKVRYLPCPYPWTSMNILWDGRIVPCCIDFWGQYNIGNVADTSLLEAWNNDKMRFLRESLHDKRYDSIPLCRKCDFLWQDTFMGISKKNIKDFLTYIRENAKI